MAQDATGTPTSKGIPKFNTAVDAPSGKGSNAQMDAIDALLDSYVPKPGSIATAEVPVWNGSAFVRSTVTNIGPTSLGSGSPDATKFLRGDGTWASPSGMSFGTALPGSPSDGDLFILTDSTSAPTYQWLLRYVSAKASNKWIFIGGSPITAEVTTGETTTSATYVALTTAGPSITLPVAGNYIVLLECFMGVPTSTGIAHMSYDIGGTGAVDADAVAYKNASATAGNASVSKARTKTGLSAVTLTAKYRSDGSNSSSFELRRMTVTPIAVGG